MTPFKLGDVVWCDSHSSESPARWQGLAIVHVINHSDTGVKWISCSSLNYFYDHADGCDAYVPTEWLTKVEGELWSSAKEIL